MGAAASCRPGPADSTRPPSRRWPFSCTRWAAARGDTVSVGAKLERGAPRVGAKPALTETIGHAMLAGLKPAPAPQLYAPRRKIYPQSVTGTFRRIKWAVLFVTLGIYYLLPFVRWDRGPNAPDQAVLIDF